ncbi:carboxylesterase/lipase family protein [Nonomuraea sp. NPDC050556]|uniref:carboxylesterase/lipase family protein n=1 Tax=Nonomuraea sp. NPDC050556 TaxID=3364369 RepID=UPI0037A1CFED
MSIVEVTQGALRGTSEDGLVVFRGVPYAAPPVGDLRWRTAQPHPGWSGVREAAEYGPSAPQFHFPGVHPILGNHGLPPFDEDCLTLNVWTPGVDDARRPVLVWIHGGGFLSGSGSLPVYAGDTFARNGDLVVVSINYRLGPLGFLHGVGDDDVWLSDQVAALTWVRDNIARFGGDPDNVTVAGQSGGALSIGALPGGLFHRAILQSAPLGLELPTASDASARTATLMDALGVADVEALRKESWQRLLEGTLAVMGRHQQWGEWALAFLPVLSRHPVDNLAASSIPIVAGYTRDEATFAFGLDDTIRSATSAQVSSWASSTGFSLSGDGTPGEQLQQAVCEAMFGAPLLDLASRRPAWVYRFDVATPAHDGRLGATHCLDLPFTFANFGRWSHAPMMSGLDVSGLGDRMHRAWISFIRTGDPGWAPYPELHVFA